MDTFWTQFSMALIAAAVPMIFCFAALRLSPETAPLGVRVPREHREHASIRRALQRFRNSCLAIAAICLLTAWFTWNISVLYISLQILSLVALIVVYARAGAGIRKAKREEDWFEGVETALHGEVANSRQIMDPIDIDVWLPSRALIWATLLIAAIIPLVTSVALYLQWPNIPEVVPVHWGPDGEPDRWSNKTVGSVFGLTIIALGIVVLMSAINLFTERVGINFRSSSGPATTLLQHASIQLNMFFTGIIAIFTSILMSAVQLYGYHPAMINEGTNGPELTGGWMIIPSVFVPLILMAMMFSQIEKIREAIKKAGITDPRKETPDNDEHYKWGMFYYNPDDPAVLVEKRVGVGVDFNYARWQGKLFLAVIVLILLGSISLVFIL